MPRDKFPGGPNIFDPQIPSAVGSKNSINLDGRDKHLEAKQIIEEEVEKIIGHISQKLPPEVLNKLDIMATIKEKVSDYVNISYVNMFNRYLTTTEDELMKKVRDFVDKEEYRSLNKYTPKEITQLIDKLAGMESFNTGEMEKSVVNMYGHLQGHIQRGLNDFENVTNSLLMQKTDVGSFVQGENAYSILKCSFKDNPMKPETVCDVKLSINILDSELISPIFQYQSTADYLIRDVISKHITEAIDRDLEDSMRIIEESGGSQMTNTEAFFERINRIEEHTNDEHEDSNSSRYRYLQKHLMDKITGLKADIPLSEYDSLSIRENIKKILDTENIRNRGYNTALNSLTAILDTSKMGYQYIENLKNARGVVIKEYENSNSVRLPDERYQITLKYLDYEELTLMQEAHEKQLSEFDREITLVWDVLEAIYQTRKSFRSINDFDDLHSKVKKHIKQIKRLSNPDFEEEESSFNKEWNEISYIKSEDSEIEKENKTYQYDHNYNKSRFLLLRKKLKRMFSNQNPRERIVLEKRIDFIEKRYEEFSYMINPYHIQPGLVLDIDITSIKKKKVTLTRMANVITEFLSGISRGFKDHAFSSFSRRRATLRDDISRSFSNN